MHPYKLLYSLLIFYVFVGSSCHSVEDFSSSPALSPKQSLKKMEVEEGFKVELIAAEPLVHSPTAMSFDEKGRMWVVEMQSYMLDTLGTGEEQPSGNIVILEDKDQDGTFESRTVFMDSLVMPRAICLIEDGILVAEPPFLWYITIQNDRPSKKVLVDDEYAIGGNVEHQPNGLVRALNNRIYNAKSDKRYRKVGDEWIIEKTHFRGQWGIAQDNYGRLYYNHNSANVLGDYFLPGFGATNTNQRKVGGFNETIVPDNRVYPSRPTSGVNRGYMDGILDSNLRLVNFTAASALTIYRGDLFDNEYSFNAFVPEPAANLIKRNILRENGNTIEGNQAYEEKEFLRSVDVRFRPVTISNGPDGALYVVDMYRGIIQHKTYLTDYLIGEIKLRELDHPNSYGRIYRIAPKKSKRESVSFSTNAEELVSLLAHPNGWTRDKAQQLLIDKKVTEAVPKLRALLKDSDNSLARIHALWTLEGLGAITSEDVIPLLNQRDWHVQMQAFGVLPSIMNEENYQNFIPHFEQLLSQENVLTAPYIAFIANKIKTFNESAATNLLDKIVETFPQDGLVADAIITNLENKENEFLKRVKAKDANTNAVIKSKLEKTLSDIAKAKDDINTKAATEKYPKGALIYDSTCSTCHGKDGYGLDGLAPQLNRSDWVTGEKDKVIATVLFGLTGPIIVNGTTPRVSGDMPGIGQNPEFSNQDIAQIISFIRNSWGNQATEVSEEEVIKIRNKFKNRDKPFTMSEIDSHWKRR
jgi:mono/diheme cytochrome c family protein